MENSKFSWPALKKGSDSSVCLEKDGNISFDLIINAGIFRDFYYNLASDIVKQLPHATSKYDMNYVRDYYNGIKLPGRLFGFSQVCVSEIMKNFTLKKQLELMVYLAFL